MIRLIQIVTICCVTLSLNNSFAQVSHDSELFQILKEKDSLMFEIGFNQCDLSQFEKLLPEKFEFYHDKDGIITSKDVFIKTFQENLCSSGNNITKRILVEGSMEIFALYDEKQLYGAMQIGVHQFGNTTAKFTHLWLKEKGQWVPSRMISYDHKMKEPTVITDINFVKLSSGEMSIYLGDYKFSPDFTLSIINEEGKLYGNAQGQKVEIKPYGNHRFLDESKTMKLTFTSNESGLISGLTMDGPNGQMTAKKVN